MPHTEEVTCLFAFIQSRLCITIIGASLGFDKAIVSPRGHEGLLFSAQKK